MGQNNDPTEHGDVQGNQGGNLSKNPKVHERLRQPEEGYPLTKEGETPFRSPKPRPIDTTRERT